MAINRIKLDIQGSFYTFNINPLSWNPMDSQENKLTDTIDGAPIRFAPFFDSRERVMEWKGLPNTSTFQNMVATLKSAINISGVRINLQDLRIEGYRDEWRPIIINDVRVSFHDGSGPSNAISHLKYDLGISFTYKQDIMDDGIVL